MSVDERRRDVAHATEMKRYIEKTQVKHKDRYGMYCNDMRAIFAIAQIDLFHAVSLAFAYGQAKGYRAAKSN